MRDFRIGRTLGAAALALLISAGAFAQDAPSIAGHFRQYQAAMQRNDLPAAEAAGAAALALSEQKDGDGGRTAVLSFNLARVRVQQGRWQEARAPALKAYTLSRAGTAGVDPMMSALLYGRVRLQAEGGAAASDLSSLLDKSRNRADLVGDRYDAADQLGVWAAQSRSFQIARNAWAHAAQTAQGASFDAQFARGRAVGYEAIATMSLSIVRNLSLSRTVTHEGRARLTEAHALVRPFAFAPAQSGVVNTPQRVYGEILAWDAALWSLTYNSPPAVRRGPRLDPNPASFDGVPACVVTRTGDRPVYPLRESQEGQIGAATMVARFDADGIYRGIDVAGYVGDEAFVQAISRAAKTWAFAVQRTETCKPALVYYVPVAFYMPD